MKYWIWLDFRLFWWYVFSNGVAEISNHSEQLPDTPSILCFFFVYRIPSIFWAALGPFLQTLQDQIQAEEFEFDAAWTDLMGWWWLGDRNFMTLKIHIHIHPYPPISIHIHPKFILHRSNMHGYVSMYLCINVSIWLHQASLSALSSSTSVGSTLNAPSGWLRSWLLSLPACQPWQSSVKSWERGGGRRWEQYPSLVWQLVYDSSFIYGLTHVDTLNALNHPWSSSSSSRASRCYCPIH